MNKPPKYIAYEWDPWYPTPEARREAERRGELPAPAKEVVGPFTADWLCKEILRRRCCSPPDHELAQLATLFNTIDGLYRARDVAGANQARAAGIHYALWVLMRFFAMRRQACEAPGVDPRIVESELRLCDQFDKFKEVMQVHAWTLDMDAGLRMWPYESFRDFAHWIAGAFRLVLEEHNPSKTNLPIAPLTAKVCGQIVGKTLEASIVGQHLRHPYQKKRSQTRHPGRKKR
jgi:hypothetical protein